MHAKINHYTNDSARRSNSSCFFRTNIGNFRKKISIQVQSGSLEVRNEKFGAFFTNRTSIFREINNKKKKITFFITNSSFATLKI